MVKEIIFKDNAVFVCERCGWMYKNNEIAEDCQDWCEKHKSCNLDFQKYAIKPLNGGNLE